LLNAPFGASQMMAGNHFHRERRLAGWILHNSAHTVIINYEHNLSLTGVHLTTLDTVPHNKRVIFTISKANSQMFPYAQLSLYLKP